MTFLLIQTLKQVHGDGMMAFLLLQMLNQVQGDRSRRLLKEIFLKFDGRFPIFRDENLYIRKGTWLIKTKTRQKRQKRLLP